MGCFPLQVEAWRAARIAELLDQFELDELLKWHDLKTETEVWDLLLDFSDEVLIERFSKVIKPRLEHTPAPLSLSFPLVCARARARRRNQKKL
jgi:hypothetical protein